MSVEQQLAALNEAYDILKSAAGKVAGYAADKPYAVVSHARDYISDQADELIAPIFEKEN